LIKFFKAIFNKISFAKATDEFLVKEYQKSLDTKYFNILYDRHHNKVYGKCLSMLNNETLSKDALQDIFLKVLLNISKFNFKSKFTTWVFSITYNHCIDVIRKEGKLKNEKDNISYDSMDYQEIDIVNEEKLLKIKVDQLDEVLNSIPLKDKAILLMKYQGGLSIKEISKILNKSESAVKMTLKRAKEKSLRKYKELFYNNI